MTVDEVFQATKVIENLEPKPGRPFTNTQNYVIVPDVFVVKDEGEWVVLLNDDGLPRMRISPYYKQLMASSQGGAPETKAYMDEKLRAAQWVIRSIEQRNKTIVKVVSSIVKFQEQFFDRGVSHLKPLVLKQVAEDIGMHESTISRVTANKYMYCPQGMLELKFFFNAGLQRTDQPSDMHSSVSVREMIKKMVAAKKGPFSHLMQLGGYKKPVYLPLAWVRPTISTAPANTCFGSTPISRSPTSCPPGFSITTRCNQKA